LDPTEVFKTDTKLSLYAPWVCYTHIQVDAIDLRAPLPLADSLLLTFRQRKTSEVKKEKGKGKATPLWTLKGKGKGAHKKEHTVKEKGKGRWYTKWAREKGERGKVSFYLFL